MKKVIVLVILAALMVSAAVYGKNKTEEKGMSLTGAFTAGTEKDVWKDASPETSLLGFGWFDGSEGRFGYYHQSRYAILEELKSVPAVPASDFTAEKMSYPVYALQIGGKDGFERSYLWTNGYLITKDGSAYYYNYDFSRLKAKKFDSSAGVGRIASLSELPNGYYLTRVQEKWDPSRLTADQEVREPEDVTLTVSSRLVPNIVLELKNEGQASWMYGEDYALQVLLNGTWYDVPANGILAFTAIGYGLEPGESRKISCLLTPFGDLPAGRYRICKGIMKSENGRWESYRLTAEFGLGSGSGEEVRKTVPLLYVLYGNARYWVSAGTSSWFWVDADGKGQGREADGPHPLMQEKLMQENLVTVTVEEEAEMTLLFDEKPDEVRIRCWDSRYQGDETAVEAHAQEIDVSEYGFFDVPAGKSYIYLVEARWTAEDPAETQGPHASGSAYYGFKTVCPAAEAEPAAQEPLPEGAVDVWENESLKNSVLTFAYFDGKEGRQGFFHQDRFEILKSLRSTPAYPADDFTPEKMTYPVYGLEMGSRDGFGISFFWTNGYLIANDGTAYRFDYDFEPLTKKEMTAETPVICAAQIPGGWLLLKDSAGRWIPERMYKNEPQAQPADVKLSVTGREGESLKLELKNSGNRTWMYGRDYWVEVNLDGAWYNVPVNSALGLAFTLEGYTLSAGETVNLSADLGPFEPLPAGKYRIGKSIHSETEDGTGREFCSVYAEFTVE